MKSNKKAFTIVELVIVIAVIAILAAVLIPTFSNMIKRSKVSADQQLIRNLNSALKADLKDHNTMTDALAAAAEFGYDVSKINKSATDNEILWDSKNDAFCYFESDKGNITYIPETTLKVAKDQLKDVDYWVIAKTPSEKYSTYLYNTELTTIVDLKTGLDVGNETITSITYVGNGSAQSVTIRTTGGTLTVNAPDDEVTHYEFADVVSVINVATASYHENGTVKFLEVTAGHIVLEKDAKVTALHFTATGEKFENAQGKQISIDLSKIAKDNLPSFSRDAVTIATDGTFVAKVTSDSDEFIWLFGKGIKEQMVVVSSNAAIAENGSLKSGIAAGCETGSVAEQIANPAKRNAEGQLVAADGETVVTAENADVEEVASKESVQIGATLFAGGSGTKNDPWMIVDYDTMQHVTTVSKTVVRAKAVVAAASTSNNYNYYASFYGSYHAAFSGYDSYDKYFETEWLPYKKYADDPTLLPTSSYYFKVKDGIKTIDCNQDGRNWKYVVLYGNFDGNGVTFVNMDNNLFSNVSGAAGEKITIKNFTVRANICTEWGDTIASKVLNDIDLIDVTIHGYVQGSSNSALYLGYGPGDSTPWNCTFKNCYSDATYVSTISTGGVYVGHPYALPSNYSIKIIDCEYTGQMYTTSGGNDCHAYTNYWGSTYYVQVSNDSGVSFTSHQGGEALSTSQQNKTGIIGVIPEKYNVFVTDAASNCDHATAFLTIGPNDNNEKGNYTNVYMTENNLRIENGKVYTDEIKYFDVTVNGNATDSTGLSSDGKVFNIVSGGYGTTYGSYFVVINQYDGNNNIISTTTFTLPLK